jgi:RimJ/RimL family protein N-acetyltransferase
MQFDHYSIRLFEEADALSFFNLVDKNRARLEDYFSGTVAKTKTPGYTEKYLQEIVRRIAEKEYFPFAVLDTQSGQMIGFIDVKRIDWRVPKGELGCFFDADQTGKGLAKKALSAVIEYFFSEHGFQKLFLRTHESNTAARALAESCGFEKEGLIRKDHITTSGKIIDLLYYGLIRETHAG